MKTTLLAIAAAMLAAVQAIPASLRANNRHLLDAAVFAVDDPADIPNAPAKTTAGPADFCATAKTDFMATCQKAGADLKIAAATSDWCSNAWAKMAKCLDEASTSSAGQSVCDEFVWTATGVHNPTAELKPGLPKAIVFWSGAPESAASFAHSQPGGKQGFVLDDFFVGKLLAGFNMVNWSSPAARANVAPKCQPALGWAPKDTIVPWERASMQLAESIKPGDDVYVILKRWKSLSVFNTYELPTVAYLLRGRPLSVRIHKDFNPNEHGKSYKRACERVQADMAEAVKPHIKCKNIAVECHDGLDDSFKVGSGAAPFVFQLKDDKPDKAFCEAEEARHAKALAEEQAKMKALAAGKKL